MIELLRKADADLPGRSVQVPGPGAQLQCDGIVVSPCADRSVTPGAGARLAGSLPLADAVFTVSFE
jgi:hypothetical protein